MTVPFEVIALVRHRAHRIRGELPRLEENVKTAENDLFEARRVLELTSKELTELSDWLHLNTPPPAPTE